MPPKRVTIGGIFFDAMTEDHLVAHVRAALTHGRGGRIITPNVDVLRQIGTDPEARQALEDSSIVVADGMPVIWASRLAGTPLPQRVSGADLIWSLSRALGRDGRSVFVVGGEPGTARRPARSAAPGSIPAARSPKAVRSAIPAQPPAPRTGVGKDVGARHDARRNAGPMRRSDRAQPARNELIPIPRSRPDGALLAAATLKRACPGLTVAGAISPPYGFESDPVLFDRVRRDVVDARPDLVLVGIGFPRQERLIASIRPDLPASWFLGCGQAINFVAGDRRRAPEWMRQSGVEWLHRLLSEPGRLGERYLRHDLPFAAALLARTAVNRYRRPN